MAKTNLRVTHVDELAPLIVGQVPSGQARELLVKGSTEKAQVVAHLSRRQGDFFLCRARIMKTRMYLASNHVLLAIPIKCEYEGLVSVCFRHHLKKLEG